MTDLDILMKVYEEHKQIIVGVDFDDTVFPLNEEFSDRCYEVRNLLRALKNGGKIVICLWTIANEQEMKYKVEIMKLWGIQPNYINESPVEFGVGVKKPYFNLLLDDKAGLLYTKDLLEQFKDKVL